MKGAAQHGGGLAAGCARDRSLASHHSTGRNARRLARDRDEHRQLSGVTHGYAATTIVLMVAVTSSVISTTTMYVPVLRIGSSRWILRRSILMPRASRIASAMS